MRRSCCMKLITSKVSSTVRSLSSALKVASSMPCFATSNSPPRATTFSVPRRHLHMIVFSATMDSSLTSKYMPTYRRRSMETQINEVK